MSYIYSWLHFLLFVPHRNFGSKSKSSLANYASALCAFLSETGDSSDTFLSSYCAPCGLGQCALDSMF